MVAVFFKMLKFAIHLRMGYIQYILKTVSQRIFYITVLWNTKEDIFSKWRLKLSSFPRRMNMHIIEIIEVIHTTDMCYIPSSGCETD